MPRLAAWRESDVHGGQVRGETGDKTGTDPTTGHEANVGRPVTLIREKD